MDVHECLKKLLKRYPEDPDLRVLEKFLSSPDSKEEMSLIRIKVMIDDAIARHEVNKCHGWSWRYDPNTWSVPYKPIIWTSDSSHEHDNTNTTAGKKVSHSSTTGNYYISL
jgi:hypothetical protein